MIFPSYIRPDLGGSCIRQTRNEYRYLRIKEYFSFHDDAPSRKRVVIYDASIKNK